MTSSTRRHLLIGTGVTVVAGAAGATVRTIGSFTFEANVSTAARAYTMPVHVHVPTAGVERPILVVMHGLQRNAAEYRDQWRELAETHRFVVVVPEFSKGDFLEKEGYNFGNMITVDRTPIPRAAWTFDLIDQVFEQFVTLTASPAVRYDLYGHSAGAQFAHRFALFGRSKIAARIVSANAGAYAWPTFDRPYPYGLGGTAIIPADLAAFLTREGWVLLGDADVDPHHPSLPDDPAAQAQGANRYARGQAFFGALQSAGAAAGVALGWRLVTVPGVAHSNRGMAVAAARLLYG